MLIENYNYIPQIEIRICDKKANIPNIKFTNSIDVSEEFINGKFKELFDIAQERFILLCLNCKNELINYSIISQGSLTSSIVHPREVLKPAILSNAASVIFLHNHPSGDVEPSIDDIEVTNRLCKVFSICGINVLDHLIIGNNDYYSFKQHNMI